ncbi:hypothetical protein MRB53_003769 [Persea americana]|uniref:Uncharacterized protein n=1 Tax=Persea americana TaxID=3435 RepID=A0ACC2MYH8_PERAE|nr:hypothetical protein MRB53_003769 [Persea americana]
MGWTYNFFKEDALNRCLRGAFDDKASLEEASSWANGKIFFLLSSHHFDVLIGTSAGPNAIKVLSPILRIWPMKLGLLLSLLVDYSTRPSTGLSHLRKFVASLENLTSLKYFQSELGKWDRPSLTSSFLFL